jgi:succinate dehydrogenase / fumarate reductase, cytochrome b subunit
MAVTGLIMVAYLLLHMLGNLKIFFGPQDLDGYARWLRTIGEPVLHGSWFLWLERVVLSAALVLHVTAAAQLSRRDRRARPRRYAHRLRARATYATRTMRWGGIIIALFLIWHLLDLSFGLVNPHFEEGRPYQNVVVDFQVWWINLIYIVAVVLVGLHKCQDPDCRYGDRGAHHRRVHRGPDRRHDGTGEVRCSTTRSGRR